MTGRTIVTSLDAIQYDDDEGWFIAESGDESNVIAHDLDKVSAQTFVHRYNVHAQLVEALRLLLTNAEAVHSFGLNDTVPPTTADAFVHSQTKASKALHAAERGAK